jgi:hypothetical protein
VREVINKAREEFDVIIGAPPVSGKTSLLQLISLHLGTDVAQWFFPCDFQDVHDIFRQFQLTMKMDFKDPLQTEEKIGTSEFWVLINEAHHLYDAKFSQFWQELIKERHGKFPHCVIRCVIAATYDLNTPDQSPVAFASKKHFYASDLRLSEENVGKLFDPLKPGIHVVHSWDCFKSYLYSISNGHVGVCVQGYKAILQATEEPPKSPMTITEDVVIEILHSRTFLEFLKCCFPCGNLLSDHLQAIAQSIC